MVFGGFEEIQKSKMADQDGRHSELITQLLRHVTSHPPSLVVIAFIFSELRRGGGAESASPPGRRRPKKSPV